MKLAVLTCAVYPSEAEAFRKLWVFRKSVEKFNIPDVHYYGIGHPWTIYRHIKLEMQLEYIVKELLGRYTHVLYTDGQDAMFTATMPEIVNKYEAMGSPDILTSAYTGFANSTAPEGFGDISVRRRFPHVGGHFSKIEAIIDAFEGMLRLPNQTSDDSFNFRDAWLEGWFRPALDSRCQIFQVTDEKCVVDTSEGGRRLLNTETDYHPCILHLAGGWNSWETGKDDRMVPWAERLGIL